MQTFDQALFELYKQGTISYDVALAHADSANDLRLMIKLSADTNPDLGAPPEDSSFLLQDENDYLNEKGDIDIKSM
jgi:twitching motility protein PilU